MSDGSWDERVKYGLQYLYLILYAWHADAGAGARVVNMLLVLWIGGRAIQWWAVVEFGPAVVSGGEWRWRSGK